MKRLLLGLVFFSLLSCNINKERRAWDIYEATNPTIISMSVEEESKRMNNVMGCYGLTLGKTTKKKAIKLMLPEKPLSESLHYKTSEFDSCVRGEYLTASNISVLTWGKGVSEKEVNVSAIFVNDTLAQVVLKYGSSNKSNLKRNLIEKYGEGNGEYKESVFGIDKNGKLNFSDYCAGYENREWQNEYITICYEGENYIHKISDKKYNLTIGGYGSAVYTSKAMANRLLYYLNKAYDAKKTSRIQKEHNELNNL